MQFFDTISPEEFHQQNFAFLLVEEADHVLTITLNRPAKKNALHPQMVIEIAYAMQYAHSNNAIWIVVLAAKGNVFCSGADLKAMAGFAAPHDSSVPLPQAEVLIGELFNKVYKPTIAVVQGDVYAGGFFFLAGSTIVIAQDEVKFGLPEVKRGLFPFQVMASLMKVMPARKVMDWCIRGYNLAVEDAARFGLITEVVKATEIEETTQEIIEELKQNSPTAIRNGLKAFDQLQPAAEQHKVLLQMLMETMGSKDGQEGLQAFREKRPPVWVGE